MSLSLPEALRLEAHGEHKLSIHFLLPPSLPYFRGHFPDSAILPGVVQLGWAIEWAGAHLPVQGTWKGIEALKFQMVLQPHDEVHLELEYKVEKNMVSFAFHSTKGRHSSGRLLFGS